MPFRVSVAVLFLLGGCGARVYPPLQPVNPVTVYLTDYGRHSTLLLPTSTRQWVEYEWGDWNWMAYNCRQWVDIPGAMLGSHCSSFSRRFITPEVPTTQAVATALAEEARVMGLQVNRADAEALRQRLDSRFLRDASSVVFNPTDQSCMARDRAHYWIFYNCNHLTADWLRELHCRVEGNTWVSKFVVVHEAVER